MRGPTKWWDINFQGFWIPPSGSPLLRIRSVVARIFVAHSAAKQLCGWVQMFTNQLKNTLINNTNDITAMSVSHPVVVIIFILPPKFFSHLVAMFQYVTTK